MDINWILIVLCWVFAIQGVTSTYLNYLLMLFGRRQKSISPLNVTWASVGIVWMLYRLGVSL